MPLTMHDGGNVAIATLLRTHAQVFLALGTFPSGYATPWTTSPPAVDTTDTELLEELGRRKPTLMNYVTVDPTGSVVVEGVTYKTSTTPTQYVHVKWGFNPGEAESETVCQFGLFVNTAVDSGTLPGQMYFVPAEITDPGILLQSVNVVPFTVDPFRTLYFETVLEF